MKTDEMNPVVPGAIPPGSAGTELSPTLAPSLPFFGETARASGWQARVAAWLGHRGTISLALGAMDAVLWAGLYTLLVNVRHRFAMDDPVALDALIRAGAGAGGFQLSVCLVQFAALALCLFIVGGYDRRTSYMSLAYMSEHLIALVVAGVVGGLFIYAGAAFNQSGIRPSRGVFLSSLMAFAPLSLVGRRSLGQMLRTHLSRSYLVVLGKGKTAWKFHESYRQDGEHQPKLCFVDPLIVRDGTRFGDTPILSGEEPRMSLQSLARLAAKSRGVVVIEDTRQLRPDLLEWLTRLHYDEVPVYTLATFQEKHWRRVAVDAIEATWPWETESHLAGQSAYTHAKRLADLVLSGIALLVLSPLFAALALLVYADSGAPVFFSQRRVGRDRQPFLAHKFRTMRVRASGEEGSLYTEIKDPRITRVGAWMRKLRLDELPQLWNVLYGDMSLIGPRAEWDRLVDHYEKAIPFYHFRHLVKPGITGWAQVNYPYGANLEDTVQKLKYDLYYIRHYSLRLDAMIVLKTLHIMIWGKGQ